MRILVIAERAERLTLLGNLAWSAGHEVTATSPVQLLSAVAAVQPEVLVIDGAEDPERARRDLARARNVLEAVVPAVLVLARESAWLHGALPSDTQPAVALGNTDLGATLDAALRRASGAPMRLATAGEAVRQLGALTWLPESREAAGPAGRAMLTASEARIMDLLFERPGVVVPTATVSRALWGT